MTSSGCRSSRIVTSPSGAWASVPRNVSGGHPGHPARQAGPRRAAIQTTSVSVDREDRDDPVAELDEGVVALAGKNDPSSQPGHASQPSPEEVSRTAAPVTMIRYSAIADATAIARKRAGDTARRATRPCDRRPRASVRS